MAIENYFICDRHHQVNSLSIITYMMSKFTTAIAVISIWLVTFVSIASICKIAGVPLPIIGKIPGWDWLKFVVELGALLFG
jgi:hypothetical protein